MPDRAFTFAVLCTALLLAAQFASVSADVRADETKAPQHQLKTARNERSDRTRTPARTPQMAALERQVRFALDIYRDRTLHTGDNGAWAVMHSFIAYGTETELRLGGPRGRKVNAIGWLCYNGPCRGKRMLYVRDGKIHGRRGPGFQGHEGQFLAMLAQSRVNIHYPVKIDGHDFEVKDLVQREMETCRDGIELTFKLIGLAHYLDSDATWTNERGESWDIPRMIREELKQTINGAACGGNHRLFGLAYAAQRREKSGLPVTDQWLRAQQFTRDYQQYTFRLQNRDGSFSTEYYKGRGADPDPAKRLLTTGHMAEWMAMSLPEDELQSSGMIRAINYLSRLLIRSRHEKLETGPQGHSLHALNIYRERVFDKRGKPENVQRIADTVQPAAAGAENDKPKAAAKPAHDASSGKVASQAASPPVSDTKSQKPTAARPSAAPRTTARRRGRARRR